MSDTETRVREPDHSCGRSAPEFLAPRCRPWHAVVRSAPSPAIGWPDGPSKEGTVMKASRVTGFGALLLGVLCVAAPASAQQRPAIADQIAKTYGFDSWGQV